MPHNTLAHPTQAHTNTYTVTQTQHTSTQIGRQHELELATAELERAQERLTALEREKRQMASAADKQPPTHSAGESHQSGFNLFGTRGGCTACVFLCSIFLLYGENGEALSTR